jgi:hypothetical protein
MKGFSDFSLSMELIIASPPKFCQIKFLNSGKILLTGAIFAYIMNMFIIYCEHNGGK